MLVMTAECTCATGGFQSTARRHVMVALISVSEEKPPLGKALIQREFMSSSDSKLVHGNKVFDFSM